MKNFVYKSDIIIVINCECKILVRMNRNNKKFFIYPPRLICYSFLSPFQDFIYRFYQLKPASIPDIVPVKL